MPPQSFGSGGSGTVRNLTIFVQTTVAGQPQLKAVTLNVQQLAKAAGVTGNSLGQLNSSFLKTAGLGTEVAKSLSNIRGTIVGLGTAMLAIGTIQMFSAAIRETIEFEQAMANVSTILDETSTRTLPQLTQEVNNLSGLLGSSTEQAKGLYQALSAGIPAAKGVDFVATTAKFAKANLADLDESVKLIAGTLNAYGMEASQAAHVTDVFSNTIKVGIVVGEELTAHLGQVINTASAAKVPLEEVGAAIAVLTSKGIPAANAITSLNATINTFLDPSEKAIKKAKALGFELNAATLAQDGLLKSMQNLARITKGDTEEVAKLFNNYRALRGVLGLTTGDMSKFALEVERNKNGVDGLTDSMFELHNQAFSAQLEGAINNLQKDLNNLWLSLVKDLTPAIVRGASEIGNYIRVYTSEGMPGVILKWADNHQTLATAITAVGVAIAGVALVNWINNLSFAVGILKGINLVMFTQGFLTLGTVVRAAVLNFGLFGTLGLVALFTAIGVAIGTLLNKIDAVAQGAERMWKALGAGGENGILGTGIGASGIDTANQNLDLTFVKLAKVLKEHGIIVDATRLKDEAYRAKLIEMAHVVRAAGFANRELVAPIKEVGNAVDTAGGEIDKYAQRLDKLNRKIEDILETLNFKIGKIGSNPFQDYLDAWDMFEAKKKDVQRLQEEAFLSPKTFNLDFLAEAAQDLEQYGNAWISVADQVETSINNTLFPLDSLNKEMDAFGKVLLKNNPHLDVISLGLKFYRDRIIEATEATKAQGEEVDYFNEVLYQQALDLKFAEEEQRKYIEFRATQWLPVTQNVIAEEYRLADAERKLIELQKEHAAEIQRLIDQYTSWADTARKIGDMFGGKISTGMNLVGVALDSIADRLDENGNRWLQFAGVINDVTNAMIQMGGKIGALGNIIQGVGKAVQGFVTENYVMMVQGLVQAFAGLFKIFQKDWAKEVQKVASALGLFISKDLAEELGKIADEMGDATLAILTNLDKIAEDVGITENNLITFINNFNTALDTFQEGSASFKDIVSDLSKVFPDMLEAATDGFGMLNQEMLAFIAHLQEMGVEIESLTNFLKDQFSQAASALEGLAESFGSKIETWATDMKGRLREILEEGLSGKAQEDALAWFDKLVEKGVGVVRIFELMKKKFPQLNFMDIAANITKTIITSKQEFEDFFTLTMAQINQMIAQGIPLNEIFNTLGGAMQTLRDAAIELGLANDPAFKSFFALFRLMKTDAAKDLANLNTLMTTFNNLGLMTAKNFGSMQDIFNNIFKEFNKDGKISRAEMTAMLPTLAQMRALAAQYGFALDDSVQAMIDLAIKRGLLPEDMPIDPMTQFGKILEDKVVPVMERLAAVLEYVVGFDGASIDIAANVTYTQDGDIPDDERVTLIGNVKGSYAGITEPVLVTQQEQVVRVHKGESIMPSAENGGSWYGGTGNTVVEATIPVTIQIGDEKIDAYIAKRTEAGYIAPKTSRKRMQRDRW